MGKERGLLTICKNEDISQGYTSDWIVVSSMDTALLSIKWDVGDIVATVYVEGGLGEVVTSFNKTTMRDVDEDTIVSFSTAGISTGKYLLNMIELAAEILRIRVVTTSGTSTMSARVFGKSIGS